jgi:hypothetical protein
MNTRDLAWAIDLHVERYRRVTIPDLVAALPGAAGALDMTPNGHPEMILARGVSQAFLDALRVAVELGAVRVEPGPVVVPAAPLSTFRQMAADIDGLREAGFDAREAADLAAVRLRASR